MRKKVIIVAMLVCISLTGVMASPLYSAKVYQGISLEGVDISGKTKAEVAGMLKLWKTEFQNKNIKMHYGESNFQLSSEHIEFCLDDEATLNEVWGYGRSGSILNRIKNIIIARRQGYYVPIHIRYNKVKLENILEQVQNVVDRPMRNAALSLNTGGIIEEEQGCKLDISSLRPLVIQSLKSNSTQNITLPVNTIRPEITTEDIVRTGIKEPLAVYSTKFNAQELNRTSNIRLAARKINGQIIYPGQKFSFNQSVGPREKIQGFKEALEIVNGEFVPGIGGGICQVSSTLYNAALLANLKVSERYNHAKPLGYVSLGRDATVVYDALDFCFINTTDQPVMVMTEIDKDVLSVGLVGQKRLDYAIDILVTDKKIVPPATIRKQDETMMLGDSVVEKKGRPGYEVMVYRVFKDKGREIKKEFISRDKYLPDNAIVRVGTQVPNFSEDK